MCFSKSILKIHLPPEHFITSTISEVIVYPSKILLPRINANFESCTNFPMTDFSLTANTWLINLCTHPNNKMGLKFSILIVFATFKISKIKEDENWWSNSIMSRKWLNNEIMSLLNSSHHVWANLKGNQFGSGILLPSPLINSYLIFSSEKGTSSWSACSWSKQGNLTSYLSTWIDLPMANQLLKAVVTADLISYISTSLLRPNIAGVIVLDLLL